MPVDESALARVLLTADVTDFLTREADLLDERRYEEWLDLLADDYQYAVPLRMNVRYEDVAERENTREGDEVCWFDEGKETARLRVAQLGTGLHWAEEPVSRVSHLVTNIRLETDRPPEVDVSCRFLVYRNRVADESDFLVGRRRDRLRRTADGDWRIVRRRLLLDQSVLTAKNLSIFV
ncbi:3-phenylpropionate/cinnamic acid dioxygenase subunit beta [Streptomyces sp. NPDC050560]|uniref:3-phenylpropionate/cinnamic acid dioxygenase subunit beta n=1 Tax=Streptomyces sp. NPDC050560 TaxID=3365630 RepID=UPI00378B33A7